MRRPKHEDRNQDIEPESVAPDYPVRTVIRAGRGYTTEEFAALVGKAEFTTREWCRHGRIRAEKRQSGRGKHCAWVIAHDELLRYRREGLLPPKH